MDEPAPIRIVIADDHALFLEGIKRLFEPLDQIELVASVPDGDALLASIARQQPDIVLTDISMPGPGAAAIVQAVDAMDTECQLIALTMHLEPGLAHQLLKLGMSGYVIKDAAFDELVEAIESVHQGDQFLSAKLADPPSEDSQLTEREVECLQLAAEGQLGKQIGHSLSISERTVRFHIGNACRKLGVRRRTEAILAAAKNGIIAL